MTVFIGIDPGKSGSIVALCQNVIVFSKLSETDHDIAEFIESIDYIDAVATIENVHSMPSQGVASSFTFGTSFGFLKGLLTGYKIPYKLVTPQKWQKGMQCLTKGNKNISKAAAQRLFPRIKITHANADALLIAEYGRKFLWNV